MTFNYSQLVQISSKDKLDVSIENKEIVVQVIFKQYPKSCAILFSRLLMQKKKGEGTISLANFKKTNIIDGKMKFHKDEGELSVPIPPPTLTS